MAGLGVLAWRRAAARGPLLFLVSAFAIALAPALPLTISLTYTVSERYVYAATVFAAILVAWMSEVMSAGRRAIAVALIVLFAAIQARSLERANRGWAAAGELAHTVTTELIELVRHAPRASRALVMNLPDTVNGIFVVRGGLFGSFQLRAPELGPPSQRIGMIASVALTRPSGSARIVTSKGRRVTIALDDGEFVESSSAGTSEYSFDAWNSHGYTVVFAPARAIQAVYITDGHARVAATLDAAPIGSVDLPARDGACEGPSLRFSGWALDDQPGVVVTIERLQPSTGARDTLGTATWRVGTRPDVTKIYREFPDADRAEWNYMLPCALVRSAGGRLEMHVVATDRSGQRTELGRRVVWVE
jgi:hypothetical protein